MQLFWDEDIGKMWMPEIRIREIESLYYKELKQDMRLTYSALCGRLPVGSCILELEIEICSELTALRRSGD